MRRLLFEQGRPLESAILEALRLFGFEAKPFSDGESELMLSLSVLRADALERPKVKTIKPLTLTSLVNWSATCRKICSRRSNRLCEGRFVRKRLSVTATAGAGQFLYRKVHISAQRALASTVHTPDLFAPAKYLKENPSDLEYAKHCREAIFRSEGEIVTFPVSLIGDETSLAEFHSRRKQLIVHKTNRISMRQYCKTQPVLHRIADKPGSR